MKTKTIEFIAWDGDDSISHKDGEYIYVKAPWHPNANRRGYVKRHRLVLEKKLGYYIPKRSIVHHLNGDKRDDSESNLELVPSQKIHASEHDSGIRNKNGQFVATDPIFTQIKYRLYNKHTQQYEIYDLSKLIRTTFRNSQFKFAGRFTGLRDKNGKEIYEGDIICVRKNMNVFFEVKFKNQYVGGWLLCHKKEEISMGARSSTELEVIGNIHQNQELLQT